MKLLQYYSKIYIIAALTGPYLRIIDHNNSCNIIEDKNCEQVFNAIKLHTQQTFVFQNFIVRQFFDSITKRKNTVTKNLLSSQC